MITFNSANIKFNLKNKTILKKWITSTIEKRKAKAGEISFVFCDDEFLLTINKKFLDHDTLTDIITFDYTKEDPKQAISGEIYISIDRIKENAIKFSKSFEDELHRVMIHGILHLLGHKDKSKALKLEMTKAENTALAVLKKTK